MIRPSKASRRRKRAERKVIDVVRPYVEDRDGPCRLMGKGFGPCRGLSQWAHWGDWRRFKTRGMAPKQRHSPEGSLNLCDGHHDDYDEHRLMIEPLTEAWCEGPLRFTRGDIVYEEPPR